MSALRFSKGKNYKLRLVHMDYDNEEKKVVKNYHLLGIGIPRITDHGCFTIELEYSGKFIRTSQIQAVKPVKGGFEFWTDLNYYSIVTPDT